MDEFMNPSDESRLAEPRGQPNIAVPSTLQCSKADPIVMIVTCFELDQALHKAELNCTSRRPIIVSLYAHGHRLGIGLGMRISFVSPQRCKPTPGPKLITVGDTRTKRGAVFFFPGWRRTEIPRRNVLLMTKAREILREFFETGVRATTAAWKVLGAEALETRWGALSNEPSVSKRFKITGTGKVLFRGAGRRHLLQGKSPKRRRSLRKASVLGPTDVYRIKQNLPFSH